MINTVIILGSGIVAYYFDHVLAYGLAFLLVGVNANALFLLQHEAMHRILFSNSILNNWAGRVISAILGTRFFDSTTIHMKHHHDLGLQTDPNMYWYDTKKNYPGWGIFRFMFFQLFGQKICVFLSRTTYVAFASIKNLRKKMKLHIHC